MVQSINKKVDMVIDATSYLGLSSYGKIMIGDQGFEFYDNRNINNFIQLPWDEVEYVIASVVFKGKWIPRYAIQTKANGMYTFSSKQTKDVLRSMNQYVNSDQMVRSLGFFEVMKRGLKVRFKKS